MATSAFGYFQAGGLFTIPFTAATSKFGAWNFHGGVDVYALGDTPKASTTAIAAKSSLPLVSALCIKRGWGPASSENRYVFVMAGLAPLTGRQPSQYSAW